MIWKRLMRFEQDVTEHDVYRVGDRTGAHTQVAQADLGVEDVYVRVISTGLKPRAHPMIDTIEDQRVRVDVSVRGRWTSLAARMAQAVVLAGGWAGWVVWAWKAGA